MINRLFRTVSFQLTALFCLIIATCFMALVVTTYVATSSALRSQLQTDVRRQIDTLAAEAGSDGIESIIQDINERIAASSDEPGYYFLSNPEGKKLAGNINSLSIVDGWSEGAVIDAARHSLDLKSDDDHQIWGQGMHLTDGSFLFVGHDALQLLTVQESILYNFLTVASVAFLIVGIAGYTLNKGFLSRIDAINTTSLAIMDGQLKQRIPVRGTSDEIDRLSANLNRLFDSNQALLESLKRVSANIAHDLRTPLSRLRQGLEEARNETASKHAYAKAIDNAIVESEQLLAIFAALLRIAQIDSGSRKAGFRNVDLNSLIERISDAYRAVAEDQGKSLKVKTTPNVHFFGDAELLLQMIANLTENAIRHTQTGASITLTLSAAEAGVRMTFCDNGPGIPEEMREKVFEHFFRLEKSRTSTGNGLGLAIVAAITRLHGIEIKLADNCPGLKVELAFPAPDQTVTSGSGT